MAQYTLEEFASMLIKSFSSYRPRVVYDTTDKGDNTMEFLIENLSEPRFSVSLQAFGKHKTLDTCTLWFGQVEISGVLDPDMAPSAIQTILDGELVAILRYKNMDSYENHRSSGKHWMYQLTHDEDDDSEALEKMKKKLRSRPTILEKISGDMTGVFEIFSWNESELVIR